MYPLHRTVCPIHNFVHISNVLLKLKLWPPEVYQARSSQIKSGKARKNSRYMWCLCGYANRRGSLEVGVPNFPFLFSSYLQVMKSFKTKMG